MLPQEIVRLLDKITEKRQRSSLVDEAVRFYANKVSRMKIQKLLKLVDFNPTIGSEISKTRPALIIQNDIANRYNLVTIVVAISSQINEINE